MGWQRLSSLVRKKDTSPEATTRPWKFKYLCLHLECIFSPQAYLFFFIKIIFSWGLSSKLTVSLSLSLSLKSTSSHEWFSDCFHVRVCLDWLTSRMESIDSVCTADVAGTHWSFSFLWVHKKIVCPCSYQPQLIGRLPYVRPWVALGLF